MPTPSDLSDRPVFVDPSGRRRRDARRIAIGVCAVLAVYVILLCAALSGAPIPPSALLPLPADTPTSTTAETATDSQNPQVTGSTTTSKGPGVTTSASPSLNRTTTSAPMVVTTTVTTSSVGNRNSHAPTTPPGHAKHTDTTTPGP